MNCNDTTALLAAYGDGELDPMQSAGVEQHLLGCTGCADRRDQQLALGARIKRDVPYYAAPPSMRSRAEATLAAAVVSPRAAPRDRGRRHWLGAGALAGSMVTVLAWITGNTVLEWRDRSDLANEAVADHVRATLANHLTDVATSDRHTVKPWLSSRLDYSPPVQDLSGEGFPLTGGRVDYLDKRPVATLVYRYREHVVDVFVRPVADGAARSSPTPPALSGTVRGFNVVRASGAGMDWVAVSDASADVLGPLVARLARGDSPP
jgi:anti-sigma factor RsiW